MKKLILLVIVLFACTTVNAAYWSFWNGSEDTFWSNPNNWDNLEVPTLSNVDYAAGMCYAANNHIDIDGYAEVKNFIMDVWGADETATLLQDAYFYQTENTRIGYVGPATFTNNGGTWILCGENSQLFVGGGDGNGGNGTYIQNGGSLTVNHRLLVGGAGADTGKVYVNAGTITAGVAEITAGSFIDFAGGDMFFGGYSPEDAAALVASYIADGRMTAFDGTGVVKYAFDEDPSVWKMHVWGEIPEPATMSLLALGGLLIGRRKK